MYCEFCGASISDSAKFCPKCGKRQRPDPGSVTLRCPDCGTENEPDAIFCENCGKKLNEEPGLIPDGTSIAERPHTDPLPAVPPPPPSGTEQTFIPPVSQSDIRETSSQPAPKPKKRSGCCSVILVILILLLLLGLAAGYYFWKVYDGAQGDPIGVLISVIKPTAESVLTKVPEAISGLESVLTKIPETISGIELKPAGTSVPMFIQPTGENLPAIRSTVVSGLVILPTATAGGSLWYAVPTVQPTAVISLENIYDVNDYSTTEMSRLSDFLWVTQDIVHGTLPAGIDWLTGFDQLLGGWKAYIIDDLYGQYGSGIERLCRVDFIGDTNGNRMTFNWSYVHNTKTDEGYNDNTPPTTFYGSMQNGRFYGSGAGSIDMAAFYVLDGHEYAVGTLHWPDGALGTVFLVRP